MAPCSRWERYPSASTRCALSGKGVGWVGSEAWVEPRQGGMYLPLANPPVCYLTIDVGSEMISPLHAVPE